MPSQQEKCVELERLHQAKDAWIIPNPWDIGSARMLQGGGFKALATSSSAFALTLGRGDGQVTLEEKLAHCTLLSAATDIPISADFEDGFSDDPEEVAKNIKRLLETGVAGCSIEDFSRNSKTLFDEQHAIERMQAAMEAVSGFDMPFQITARCENLLRGSDDFEATISRLQAYEATGAHVLFAPGIKTLAQIEQLKPTVSRPLNILSPFLPGVSLQELEDAGATRISLGGALSSCCTSPLIEAMREMNNTGSFSWLSKMANGKEVNRLLS